VADQLAALEHLAYEWQLKIFDVQIDILTEDERRVHSAIDFMHQQIAGMSTVCSALLLAPSGPS